MSPTVKLIAIFSDFRCIFESKVTLIAITDVFAELFRTKCLPTAKLLRFLLFRNKVRNAGRSGENAGYKPKGGISRTIAGRFISI